jgi:hypothetical protein
MQPMSAAEPPRCSNHASGQRDTTDPRIDALLREHSTQDPPAHIDAAILAAAHRAVGSRPRKTPSPLAGGPLRWWMPLVAAAAIGVVVIGILPLAPTAPEPSPAVVDDARAPASPPTETRRDAPVAREREDAAKSRSEFAAPPPARPAPPAPVAAAPAAKPDRAERPMQKRQNTDSTAGESRAANDRQQSAADKDAAAAANAGAPPSPVPQALPAPRQSAGPPASAATGVVRESVDADAGRATADWIARIRSLRNANNVEEARAELTRFRAAFADADARLPADLRAWAASVR